MGVSCVSMRGPFRTLSHIYQILIAVKRDENIKVPKYEACERRRCQLREENVVEGFLELHLIYIMYCTVPLGENKPPTAPKVQAPNVYVVAYGQLRKAATCRSIKNGRSESASGSMQASPRPDKLYVNSDIYR